MADFVDLIFLVSAHTQRKQFFFRIFFLGILTLDNVHKTKRDCACLVVIIVLLCAAAQV